MVKRFAQLSVAVFLVLALATMATAAPNVAGVVNKGSLLVFPLVMNTTDVKTAIFIGNDQTSAVMIKCYWMDQNQNVEDFHFKVTANEPIVFWSDFNAFGPPFADDAMGSLMCWAQDDADQKPAIPAFNHLYGTALLSSGYGEVMYNAYAFTYSGAAIPITPDGVTLTLNGGNVPGRVFDACPKYLVSTFMPDGADFGTLYSKSYPALALWPCNQDLRQDREGTIVKVKIDAWDEYENKYTGAYQCFKCFYEGFLAGDPGKKTSWPQHFGKEKFTLKVLGEGVARIRVQAANNKLCDYDGDVDVTYALTPGLLGLLLYDDDGNDPFVPIAGKHMVGAGTYTEGWIFVDPAQAVEDAAGR